MLGTHCRALTIHLGYLLMSAYCRVLAISAHYSVLIAGYLPECLLQRAYCRTLNAEALNMRAYIRMLTTGCLLQRHLATIRSGKSKVKYSYAEYDPITYNHVWV